MMETLSRRYDRATFLFDSGDYIGAARALAEIVATDPDASGARLLLGRTLQRQSRHDEAAGHLRLAEAMTAAD